MLMLGRRIVFPGRCFPQEETLPVIRWCPPAHHLEPFLLGINRLFWQPSGCGCSSEKVPRLERQLSHQKSGITSLTSMGMVKLGINSCRGSAQPGMCIQDRMFQLKLEVFFYPKPKPHWEQHKRTGSTWNSVRSLCDKNSPAKKPKRVQIGSINLLSLRIYGCGQGRERENWI